MTTEDCQSCEWRKGMANKNKGVKIPGEHGKCTRPEGLCKVDSALLPVEKGRLQELETVIQENFLSFYKVGCALKEIGENRLYRETHKTFELYCRDLWEVSKSRAYQLVDSAKAVENLSTIVDKTEMPSNEAQIRPLTKLKKPEQQVEAWQAALDFAPEGKITARHVKNAVKELVGENVKRKIKEVRKKINKEKHASMDFKRAYSDLLTVIKSERDGGWKSTTKVAVLYHLEVLKDVVNAG